MGLEQPLQRDGVVVRKSNQTVAGARRHEGPVEAYWIGMLVDEQHAGLTGKQWQNVERNVGCRREDEGSILADEVAIAVSTRPVNAAAPSARGIPSEMPPPLLAPWRR